MQQASARRRLGALAYDAIGTFGIAFGAGFIALALFGDAFLLTPYYSAYQGLVLLIVYGCCWTIAGQTLGMRTWSLMLIDKEGKRISWWIAFARFAIITCTFCLSFSWIFFRKDRRTLHDVATKTSIILLDEPTSA